MEDQPSYYAIIPATVRYDKRLKKQGEAKLLFGEVTALANKHGYCFASNSYFAKLYDVSTRTVSRWVNKLKELGYLKVVSVNDKEHNTTLRKLYPIVDPLDTNVHTPLDTNVHPPIVTDVHHNNTSINNTRTTSDESDKWVEETKEVLDYLNQTTGFTKFKASKDLRARLNQGYTVAQCKSVIYYCAVTDDWLHRQNGKGKDMAFYLKPDTLFRKSNFERYLENARNKARLEKSKQLKAKSHEEQELDEEDFFK